MFLATKGTELTEKFFGCCCRIRVVYAAQFHIEMAGTPETSRVIMANFLRLAAQRE